MLSFEDTTAAFAYIACAQTPRSLQAFAASVEPPQNSYFMRAVPIAINILGAMEKVDRTLPAHVAFDSPNRIIAMLQNAGPEAVTAQPVTLRLLPPDDAQQTAELSREIRPANCALKPFQPNATDGMSREFYCRRTGGL